MMPQANETKICKYCVQVIVHPHITVCPSCGGELFWSLIYLIELGIKERISEMKGGGEEE